MDNTCSEQQNDYFYRILQKLSINTKKIKTRKYYHDTKSLYEIDPIERILLGFEIGILYLHHGHGIFESERAVPVERHLG